jgi:hypothetical protein
MAHENRWFSLAIKNGWIFYSYVKLPEGIYEDNHEVRKLKGEHNGRIWEIYIMIYILTIQYHVGVSKNGGCPPVN